MLNHIVGVLSTLSTPTNVGTPNGNRIETILMSVEKLTWIDAQLKKASSLELSMNLEFTIAKLKSGQDISQDIQYYINMIQNINSVERLLI